MGAAFTPDPLFAAPEQPRMPSRPARWPRAASSHRALQAGSRSSEGQPTGLSSRSPRSAQCPVRDHSPPSVRLLPQLHHPTPPRASASCRFLCPTRLSVWAARWANS